MRPTWSGMISFGLVNIPVGLYPATEDKDISFHFLHQEDHGKIKNQRVCSKCGKIVPFADLERGYEYDKGEYVVLDDEDFKKAAVKSNDSIAIEDFVDPTEIDPVYFEKPYYIKPDKKAGKAYTLLYKALQDTGKVGLAKIAFRTKERLAALKAGNGVLMLYTMHFADEVREAEAAPPQDEVGERELKMAEMLIDTMTDTFDPSKYHDTYNEAMHAVIESKLKGKELQTTEAKAEPTNVIDLISYLKASIEQSEKKAKPEEPVEAEKPARRRRSTAA